MSSTPPTCTRRGAALERFGVLAALALLFVGSDARAAAPCEEGAAAGPALPAEERLEPARAKLARADELLAAGELAEARDLLSQVIALLEDRLHSEGESGECIALLDHAGQSASAARDPVQALRAFERVLDHHERTLPGDDLELQASRQRMATALGGVGRHAEARELALAALRVLTSSRPEHDRRVVEVRVAAGNAAHALGDVEDAARHFETIEAALAGRASEEEPVLQIVRVNLASVRVSQGDLGAARSLFEQVLAVRERTLPPAHLSTASVRLNLANVLRLEGDLPAARRTMEEGLRVLESQLPEEHPLLLSARSNLAITLKELGDLAGARAAEEQVLAVRERTLPPDHLSLQNSRQNLAVTLKRLGDAAGARRLFEEVLRVREAQLPPADPQVLLARQNLASVLADLGAHEPARELLERVIADGSEDPGFRAQFLFVTRLNLAQSHLLLGDLPAARTELVALAAEGRASLPADHSLRLDVSSALCELLLTQGDAQALPEALEELASGLQAAIQGAAIGSPRECAERLGDLRRRLDALLDAPHRPALACSLLESARAAALFSARAGARLPPTLLPLAEAARAAREHVQRALDGAGTGATEQLAARVRVRDEAEARLRTALRELGILAPRIEVERIAGALPDGAAAVSFAAYQERRFAKQPGEGGDHERRMLAAFVVRPGGEVLRVTLGEEARIAEAVSHWREALGQPLVARGRAPGGELDAADESEREAGLALRRLVLDPVLALSGGARVLFACLEGPLHLVPLDALPTAEGRVGDALTLRVESSFARLCAEPSSLPGHGTLLALGGIDYSATRAGETHEGRVERSGSWSPLPGTAAEVAAIAALHARTTTEAAVLLRAGEATAHSLRARCPDARWLHVATHGWFAPESVPSLADPVPSGLWSRMSLAEAVHSLAPMALCGLALAGAGAGAEGGVLSAEEVAGLDLSSCELAVLSACETNVGIRRAGQGIQSLQAALHAAGARTAITSLWKVEDEATRDLMERFYTYLWQEERPKAEALWRAKQDLRAAGRPVRDWAGWVLSGDPG